MRDACASWSKPSLSATRTPSPARPDFVRQDPFLHLVGDHLYVCRGERSGASNLVATAEAHGCSVSAVQPTRESLLARFGTVGGRRVPGRQDLYRVDTVIEKPTPTEAEQRLIVPGLRAGYYLCFFGMHVLTPAVMEILARQLASGERRRHAVLGAGRTGAAGAVPGAGTAGAALRPGRAVRPADRADGAGAERARPRRCWRACWNCWPCGNWTTARSERDERTHRASSPPPIRPCATAPSTPSAAAASIDQLLAECAALDRFRRDSDNLYERVRALFFLYAIHRFHLPFASRASAAARSFRSPASSTCWSAASRRPSAIFLAVQAQRGPSDAISSALAAAYRGLGFQTLADQVRRSVRSVRGNQWMFRIGHPADHPLRLRPELLRAGADGLFPILHEATPVRMDLTHSGWSDIFFLGHGFPRGRARAQRLDRSGRARRAARRPSRRSRPISA